MHVRVECERGVHVGGLERSLEISVQVTGMRQNRTFLVVSQNCSLLVRINLDITIKHAQVSHFK